MKTPFQIALPLLVVLLGASSAHAQLNVSGSADCPLEAFDVVGVVDSAPMPAVTVKIVNGATPQTGVEVDFTIPADTYFAGFLAPVPASVLYFDGSTWSATLPTLEPVAVRVVLGNLAGGANETFGVMLREYPTPGPQTSYGAVARTNENPTGVAATRTLRLGACPALVYALNCLDGTNTECIGQYLAIEGRLFTFAGVGGAPTSPLTSAQPTDQDGFTLLPREVDLTFLNGDAGDLSNDGYPLPGASYTVSHTLPADPAPPSNGPFWSNTSAGTVVRVVAKTRSRHPISFVDNASCDDVVCQSAIFRLTTEGAGLCEYDPIVVGGECTLDDPCLTNLRCEAGACVGDPIVCEDPGTCQSQVGSCDEATGQCAYNAINCATETFTFFGVIDNGGGSLSSFECQINDAVGEVLCRVAGGGFATTGELLLGGPECVSAVINDPPYLPPTRLGAEQGAESTFQLAGTDTELEAILYASSNLPSGWTLSSTGLLTVPASAPLGDYSINVTLDDGTNTPVPATITMRVLVAKYVFATQFSGQVTAPIGLFAADFANQGVGTAIQNADAICQQQASSLGGPAIQARAFVAWLSSASVNAKDRIADALYKMPNGVVVVRGKPSLLGADDGTPGLEYGIDTMANGAPLPWAQVALTGTSELGVWAGFDCNGWTTTATSSVATRGFVGRNLPNGSTARDYRWTRQSDSHPCSQAGALICFEQ